MDASLVIYHFGSSRYSRPGVWSVVSSLIDRSCFILTPISVSYSYSIWMKWFTRSMLLLSYKDTFLPSQHAQITPKKDKWVFLINTCHKTSLSYTVNIMNYGDMVTPHVSTLMIRVSCTTEIMMFAIKIHHIIRISKMSVLKYISLYINHDLTNPGGICTCSRLSLSLNITHHAPVTCHGISEYLLIYKDHSNFIHIWQVLQQLTLDHTWDPFTNMV